MKVPLQLLCVSCAVFTASAVVPLASQDKDKLPPLNFSRDVKPIISEHCFKCHGPDAATVAAGLRLDLFKEATKNRDGSIAVVPGKPDDSLLWQRISHKDKAMQMPPPDSGVGELTDAQKATLKRWISEGAKYEEHWSFIPPTMPAIPKVSDEKWAKNPIDRFVLAKLDKAGLKPEPEADRPTLAMRAALTLTGLPPSPEDVEKFVKDKSPMAYEKYVDSLLASPTYGEHQGRFWLDAVRYGDTHGLHLDNERSIFPYRDWVVRAFNEDLPFDKFTLWQLAGDMLPNPTVDQMIATGYVRMNPTTSEGGAIEEEFLAKNTFDRVDTTSTVFLGMTIGCARCHDHKYDPIKQKEYYGLYAFFNSTTDAPLDGNAFNPAPTMKAPTPEQAKQVQIMATHMKGLLAKTKIADAEAWLQSAWQPMPTGKDWQISPVYTAASFDEAFAKAFIPETGDVSKIEWKASPFQLGKDSAMVVGKDNASVYLRGTINVKADLESMLSSSSDDGMKVWVNGQLVHEIKVLRGLNQATDRFKVKLKAGDNSVLIKVVNATGNDGVTMRFGDATAERIDRMKKMWTEGKPADKKPDDLKDLYLEIGPVMPISSEYRKVKASKMAFEAMIPETLVAQEMPKPRPSYVLRRGEYNLKGEEAPRVLPVALGTLDKKEPVNRLGLAEWMVSKRNPLMARVFVNRIWQQHFGTGIVKTSEDFGSQGEWPINPELLDYLAVTFVKDGWSVKKLHRMMVTSAAFRQRSSIDKEKLAKDTENRLVSRGPRFRLDAEVIRDKVLAASGLLIEKVGGKGFKPYQPEGIWEALAFADSNTARYVKDMNDDIYRRSLYLFWKRTSPHPVMLAFDAPMREACTVRRFRTNTPLQALVSLNEPAFVEASRALAQRVLQEENNDADALNRAFEYTLSRSPNAKEKALLTGALARYRANFAKYPASAGKILKVGDSPRDLSIPAVEHAAWMMVCSTIMNTDEFLSQH